LKPCLSHFVTNRVWCIKNLSLMSSQSVMPLRRGCRKIAEAHFPGEATIYSRGQLVLLARRSPPFHSALIVKTFLAKHGVMEINHPPHSPDLAPDYFFLCSRRKDISECWKHWEKRDGRTECCPFGGHRRLFSKSYEMLQQIYSSWRRLLRIEIKQFFIFLYYLFIFLLHYQTS
jgi:hypothetical protein